MTKNLSRKLPLADSEVFVLIIPQVSMIRMHWHLSEWEAVAVCRPRRGMRIFVLIIPQVIRIDFNEWVVIAVVAVSLGLKLLEDIDILGPFDFALGFCTATLLSPYYDAHLYHDGACVMSFTRC